MMQYVPSANLQYAKAGCYLCGNPNDLVDLGAYVEGEGALAICRTHLIDAMLVMRFPVPEDVAALAATVAELKEQVADAREKIKQLHAKNREQKQKLDRLTVPA